jgi:hypothetical protein
MNEYIESTVNVLNNQVTTAGLACLEKFDNSDTFECVESEECSPRYMGPTKLAVRSKSADGVCGHSLNGSNIRQ